MGFFLGSMNPESFLLTCKQLLRSIGFILFILSYAALIICAHMRTTVDISENNQSVFTSILYTYISLLEQLMWLFHKF